MITYWAREGRHGGGWADVPPGAVSTARTRRVEGVVTVHAGWAWVEATHEAPSERKRVWHVVARLAVEIDWRGDDYGG